MSNSSDDLLAEGRAGIKYPDWSTSEYVLSYPTGQSYKVRLNTCSGSFHSEGEPDAFAIDFEIPIGEYITASRARTVVHVEESGIDFDFPNNLVIIQEEVDTSAQYIGTFRNNIPP